MYYLLMVTVCFSLSLAPGAWGLTTADNPGIRTVFTTKAVDYFKEVGIPYLKSELTSLQIPDLSGSSDVVIGEIDYEITNIQIEDLEFPTSSLTTSAGTGLTLQASDISVALTADWSYELDSLIPVSDDGTVDVSGSGVSLSMSVLVEADANGHFVLSSSGCSFYVSDLDVTFHGGASWLYNLFDDTIASDVKDSLNSEVCDAATKAINNAGSKALESLPISVSIDKISRIDYALIQSPTFTSSYVQCDIKGEIQSITDPVEYPFTPSPLPPVSTAGGSKMVYLWMTDYVANTASAVYQKAGILSFTISDDMIPKNSFFHLNTQSLALFIPGLQKKYPNMNLKVVAHAVKPPTIKIKPHGANLTLPANVDVYVIDTATNSTPLAFTIGVLGDLVFTPYLTSENGKEFIKGKALALNAKLSLVKSNVGNFDVGKLQDVFDSLTKTLFIPEVNQYGQKGLLLPVVDGLSFSGANLTLGEGYVAIASDFNYKPNFI